MRQSKLAVVAAAVLAAAVASVAEAVDVTDWHAFRANTAPALAGQGTNDPVFGSIAAPANNGFLVGYLPAAQTLVNTGDMIELTFKVSFHDATGVGTGGDNFRFALFNTNGQPKATQDSYATAGLDGSTDDWRGYWFGHRGGGGAGAAGSMRERFATLVSGDNVFAAASPNNTTVRSLGAVGGDPVTIVGSVEGGTDPAPLYTGVMKLTKTDAGVDLSGTFKRDDMPETNVFAASDTELPTPLSFDAVAFLDGAGVNAEQLNFFDVTVTYTPAATPLVGDTNDDGVVDLADLNNVLNNFGATGANPGDDDGNGVVDLADLNNVLNNFGNTAPASALSVVPEPGTASVLVVGAMALVGRRRR